MTNLDLRGEALIKALGFTVEQAAIAPSLLRIQGTRRALAVFLDEGKSPEVASQRFNGQSPGTYPLATAGGGTRRIR